MIKFRLNGSTICTLLSIGLLIASIGRADAQERNRYPPFGVASESMSGSAIYLRYCAGCHGFDGFASYEHAPSISMGERLHKSDLELLRSVVDGKHAMPYWKHKLSEDMLLAAIGYMRVLEQRYRSGLPPREEPLPDLHYKFKPVGEDEDYWRERDRAE